MGEGLKLNMVNWFDALFSNVYTILRELSLAIF